MNLYLSSAVVCLCLYFILCMSIASGSWQRWQCATMAEMGGASGHQQWAETRESAMVSEGSGCGSCRQLRPTTEKAGVVDGSGGQSQLLQCCWRRHRLKVVAALLMVTLQRRSVFAVQWQWWRPLTLRIAMTMTMTMVAAARGVGDKKGDNWSR